MDEREADKASRSRLKKVLMKFLFLIFFTVFGAFAQGFTPTPTQTGTTGAGPTLSCVGTPGNTIGAYKSQCQATNGNVYACNNSAGCSVASDWVQIGGGATGQPAAPLNSLQLNAGGGNFGPAVVGTNYQGPTTQVVGQGTVNTNLANTISNCTSTPCYVVIPANYGGGEQLSSYGFSGDITQSDSSSLPTNISVFDLRSNAGYSFNNCYYIASNQCSGIPRQSVFSTAMPFSYQNRYQIIDKWSILAGGYFQPGAVSNYQQHIQTMYGKTHGQMNQNLSYNYGTSASDVIKDSVYVGGPGGVGYSGFSEGHELMDFIVGDGGSALNGTAEPLFTSTASGTGLNSITISAPSQGAGQLGERPIVDTSAGVVNTVTAWSVCADPGGNAPCVATIGTPVSVSTVYGTSTTALTTIGSQSVTINTFIVGSTGSLSVGQVACLFDGNDEPDCAKITAVSGAAITITTHFQHEPSNSQPIYIGIGGLTGNLLSINADNVTSSTYPEITLSGQSITGTLHLSAWPIIACTTTTSCVVAVQGKGAWRSIVGADKWSASNNGVTIYPAARVLQVATNAGVDSSINGGPITLEDNTMTFVSGHTYTQFNSPAVEVSNGNWSLMNLKNNFPGAAGGYILNSVGLITNNDCMLCLNNNTNVNWYSQNGGTFGAPYGLKLSGQYSFPFLSNYGGFVGDVSLGCPSTTGGGYNCYDAMQVIHKQSSTAGNYDALVMMGAAGHGFFGVTYNNMAGNYFFSQYGIEQPCIASNSAAALRTGDVFVWVRCSDYTLWANDTGGAPHQIGGSSTGNATSIQGNPVHTGTATLNNQVYSYNATNGDFELTVFSPLVAGQGTAVNTNGSNKEVDSIRPIRTVSGTTDSATVTDCGGIVIFTSGTASTESLPTANSPVGTFQEGCTIRFVAQGAALTINTGASSVVLASTGATSSGTTVSIHTFVDLDSHSTNPATTAGNWYSINN